MRSSAKVLLVNEGKVLLNRCRWENSGGVYYDLPGGGQHQYESLEEAAIREVKEETGYNAEILRFAALCEEICINEELREKYPEYCHRLASVFVAKIVGHEKTEVSEMDYQQEESLWVDITEADSLPVFPKQLRGKIAELISGDKAMYLGCCYEAES